MGGMPCRTHAGTREITVYAIRTDTVRQMDLTPLEKIMPGRISKAGRFRFEKDRLLCLGAGFLMLEGLGIRHEEEIRYGENGRPFVPGYPDFNISHSGRYCVLATCSGGPVGIDIEETDEAHTEIAPEVYTQAELDWMLQEDSVNRFFRLWTWKESVMKATGLGMALEPRKFDVLPFVNGGAVRIRTKDWYARGDILDNCMCSVCTDAPVDLIRWVPVPSAAETSGSGL